MGRRGRRSRNTRDVVCSEGVLPPGNTSDCQPKRNGNLPPAEEMPQPNILGGPTCPDPQKANFEAAKVGSPVSVGRYPPNGYGVYDMAGNVWEFTADNWKDTHDAPELAAMGSRKVIRGGSFGADPLQLRVTFRDSHKPDDPVPHVGFRCVRSN